MPAGRVLVAFNTTTFDQWTPTWTRLDSDDSLVSQISIRRGRQTELDQTDTSTATVTINDTAGLFDPGNTASPYWLKLDGKQILLQLYDPVTAAWVPQYRGWIDEWAYDHHPSQAVSYVTLECVDIFEYLAGVEFIPGTMGDLPVPTDKSEGTVVYAETDWQTRMEQILGDAGLADQWFVVFTGNVMVQEQSCDAGDSLLAALRDVCDAEFPGVANCYSDKQGRFVAHGRMARFDPDTTAGGADWDFNRWKAGDGDAILLDPTRAQIRPPLRWRRPRSRIINAALAYPRSTATDAETRIAGQIVVDATSRGKYGYRSWSARDLLTQEGIVTGEDMWNETKLFAAHYIANYKDPRTFVEALTFKSVRPTDPRAEPTWALIAGVDVSDVIQLEHGYPGGLGISQDFYVEGSEMTITPAGPGYDNVELTVNVSPADLYSTSVFG